MMKSHRKFYLEDIPMVEAQTRLKTQLRHVRKYEPLDSERIPLRDALGRITAEPIWALKSSPHYHASAMDGYAVNANSTLDATETRPIQLSLKELHAIPVNTGEPLPEDANAVIMIEHVQHVDADIIEIVQPVVPWQHVRMMGEDIVATELLLPSGHRLRPVDLGAIAGCGHTDVPVRRKPYVILIPTGSELVSPGEAVKPGQIVEYNSLVLGAQLEEAGAIVEVTSIIPDDMERLRNVLHEVPQKSPDLVLILSGSSAGDKDFTASVLAEVGDVFVHGVAVRPGHPVIMGMVNDLPVIGVPGYPVSAALTVEIFVLPLIRVWLGLPELDDTKQRVSAKLTRKLMSPVGDDDFVRIALAKVDEELLATPLGKGAGVITSLMRADGLAHIPRFSEGANIGESLDVTLYQPLTTIERAILISGSHDPLLDLVNQFLMNAHGIRLTSTNVGSIGGLVALKRGHAHAAGVHLLDPESGVYNLKYVRQYLGDQPVKIITFAEREQGLIVARGNPKNIQKIADLPHVTFVNRQRGAGTRLLLDYELSRADIDPDTVRGYEREEYTHLAVAVAVATGIADCGMGVRNAAVALDLDFVSIGWERFDIVIPETHMKNASIQKLIEVLQSERFESELHSQPGYRSDRTGEFVQ